MPRSVEYSAEEIDIALAVFAIEGGRERRVRAQLRAAGLKATYKTVHRWAYDTYHERYERISIEVEKQVGAKLADTFHRLAAISAELGEEVLDRIRAALKRCDEGGTEVDFRDLAKLLHESGIMGGIATEKLQLLKGNPTQLVEHSFPEIRAALERKGVRMLPPGSAQVIDLEPLPAGD